MNKLMILILAGGLLLGLNLPALAINSLGVGADFPGIYSAPFPGEEMSADVDPGYSLVGESLPWSFYGLRMGVGMEFQTPHRLTGTPYTFNSSSLYCVTRFPLPLLHNVYITGKWGLNSFSVTRELKGADTLLYPSVYGSIGAGIVIQHFKIEALYAVNTGLAVSESEENTFLSYTKLGLVVGYEF